MSAKILGTIDSCYIAGVVVEWPLMKVIITFVAITYGKVSLWLWKSLENSRNFFSYFVATVNEYSCTRRGLSVWHILQYVSKRVHSGSIVPFILVKILRLWLLVNKGDFELVMLFDVFR